jgi:flagellar biosynthesis/type III secretory pathway protein FliH
MGKKSNRKKAMVPLQLHTPPVLAVITADAENEPEPQNTTGVEPVRQLNVHPFEVLLTGARNAGMTDGLQEGARMRKELEVKLLEAREYIEKMEQRECSESNRHVAEIANSWAAGRRSGLEEGADAGKAELLPQLERLQAHVSKLENALRNEEELHDAEVAVVRKKAYVLGHEEIAPHVSAKPADERRATSCKATYTCTRPMFDLHESSRDARPNPWASIAQRHTRYSRTRTRRLRTNIFCKSDTLSSQYIIPSRRTSPFITDTNFVPNTSLTTFSDILAYSLTLPSHLFSLF